MKSIHLAMLAGMLAAATAAPGAHAQINPFAARNGPALADSDWAMVKQAEQTLARTDPLPDGATAGWANKATGNSGSLTVLGRVRREGFECRRVRYDASFAGRNTPRSYAVVWCHTPDGWKLAS